MNSSRGGMPARLSMLTNRRSLAVLAVIGAVAAMVGMASPAAASPVTESARFAVVPNTDEAFTLPDSNGNKRTFNFDLPGLIGTPANSTVIMMFKATFEGNTRLRMRIKDNPGLSIDFTLPSPAATRSWHEIVGPEAGVKASGNVLSVLEEGSDPAAKVIVSDIVFLYPATVS